MRQTQAAKLKGNNGTKAARKPVEFFPEAHADSEESSDDSKGDLVLRYRMKARKLARSILRKWHSRLDLQEVDSIVDLSLCEAVARYNPEKGASFMTFLFYHLRGNLIRAVSYAASANALPIGDDATTAGSVKSDARANALYRGASASEIAEALCGQDRTLPDEQLFMKQLVSLSQSACSKLDALEQEVIDRIYLQEQQLMDIANTLGYSRCHISRVKRKALEALYNELSSNMGEEAGKRPFFSEEEEESAPRRKADRRRVYRRRPRSKASSMSRVSSECAA